MLNTKNYNLSGTKAETLLVLSEIGYNVPEVLYFTVEEWNANPDKLIQKTSSTFQGKLLAVRSSTKAEDTEDSSMAGAFESLLNIK
jgi:hypothetical protein